MTTLQYRRANRVVFALILVINAYIIFAPLLPLLTFTISDKTSSKKQDLSKVIATGSSSNGQSAPGNRIIVPDMLLNTPVIEGPKANSFDLLNKGAWRLPYTSTPDKGGNTVIIGHRFSYTGPRGIFYYLDKLKVGSEIGLKYNDIMYQYRVVSTRTVPATEISVEGATSDARLTLYTCTPLWNPVNRLVVVAKPIEMKSETTP